MALTALDSSVLIPAVAPWHAEHGRVDRVLARPRRCSGPAPGPPCAFAPGPVRRWNVLGDHVDHGPELGLDLAQLAAGALQVPAVLLLLHPWARGTSRFPSPRRWCRRRS